MRRRIGLVAIATALGVGAVGCVADDTYASCADDLDCDDLEDACWIVTLPADDLGAETTGRFCSHECASDADCEYNFGFSGACYAIERDARFLCYQRCDFDGDCWSGSVCREVEVDGAALDAICSPLG